MIKFSFDLIIFLMQLQMNLLKSKLCLKEKIKGKRERVGYSKMDI